MELSRYVDQLRQELSAAVETGDEEARELAERLIAPLGAAVRLTLLDALSAAADEITRDLAPGSVEIRLRGLDPAFVVTPPAPDRHGGEVADGAERGGGEGRAGSADASAAVAGAAAGEERQTSRINFRPPERLKSRIEEAAGRERLSVNAWLVREVSALLDSGEQGRRSRRRPARAGARSYTGWVN
ncbi:hypothetical protein [Streptomyces sp. CC224B]|uniref:hypothetical protein n=1 Tax=Streptomyces sp. CC224B TaxID=3044571 RepID=UPI0024A9504A|nr:hypothetical protein [Streptomyces sp. CC224B]